MTTFNVVAVVSLPAMLEYVLGHCQARMVLQELTQSLRHGQQVECLEYPKILGLATNNS